MSDQGSAGLAVVDEEGKESLSLENETPTPPPPRGLIEQVPGGLNEPPPLSCQTTLSAMTPISPQTTLSRPPFSAQLPLPKFLLVRLPSAESVRLCR